jgi:hypothetical protein
MAGAQFKQNRPKFVKPIMRCDTAETVGYSEWRLLVERYTFTHDSFFPIIIPDRSPAAPGPYDRRPREDTL